MTRSAGEVAIAREFFEQGLSVSEVARQAGVPRSTVRDWVDNGFSHNFGRGKPLGEPCDPCTAVLNVEEEPYAYALGLYLGDGCISTAARTHKLRISLDQKYPRIIDECKMAIGRLLPNPVGQVQRIGCVEITSHSQHWPCFFPQHGVGPKHLRPIVLEPWQTWVAIERHPHLLLRGLIHSDGCRFTNRVRRPAGTYEYPRYMFCNHSIDIQNIFTLACDRVGVEWRRTNRWNLAVSKREYVALMDSFIGPKS